MKTTTVKPSAPQWILLNAEGMTLGRLATSIASSLRGKHRREFSPHQIYGDHVIVINAEKLSIHPSKLAKKVFHRHTGYLGHLKEESLKDAMKKNPAGVIEHAVKGMLPKNRLRAVALKRLHVYAGSQHSHEAQKPLVLELNNKS
jgi:large subunit ribosomal protein L13